MKKLKVLFLITISIMVFVGCKEKQIEKEPEKQEETTTGIYDILTDEQKAYLEEIAWDEQSINLMLTYEELNWELIGTGLELYNQSGGVERYGVTYNYPEYVDASQYGTYYHDIECTSEKQITLAEADALRGKELDMRLDDFLEYSYIKVIQENNALRFYLPLADYENVYVALLVKERGEGTITLRAYLMYAHREGGEFNDINYFSLLYEQEMMKGYVSEPVGTYEDKLIPFVHRATVTNKSVVVCFWDGLLEDVTLYETYELYKVENDKDVFITERKEAEVITVEEFIELRPVTFFEDDTVLEPGEYKMVYGTYENGDTVGTMYFEVK